jgi:hypothetical protein
MYVLNGKLTLCNKDMNRSAPALSFKNRPDYSDICLSSITIKGNIDSPKYKNGLYLLFAYLYSECTDHAGWPHVSILTSESCDMSGSTQ